LPILAPLKTFNKMKRSATLTAAAVLAGPALAQYETLVTSEELQALINLEDLLAGTQQLQDFADANGGERTFGSAAHNATVDYIYETLTALDYFDVVKQPFTELYSAGTAELTAAGTEYEAGVMTYSPAGVIQAVPLVAVANLGCVAEDYPAEVAGAVALISRGECPFAAKATNANTAGAAAALVYNNVPGDLAGTLGGVGDYVPIVGISQEDGATLLDAIAAGEVVIDLRVAATTENRTNYNVIAETRGGDKNNVLVLGGHTDSVAAGPGINDNGSGSIGVLNVAVALSNFAVNNAVRFAFWGAEEFGLLGSYFYINSINQTEEEIVKIRAYLNFDMIASPNYVLGIYDGDGSSFNLSGPTGSDVLEEDFESFFTSQDEPFVASAYTGRSDYAAFIENGIPSGGLFTGAEVLKTEEEAALFGGEAGAPYDANYHRAGDTIDNLNHDAFLINSLAIANSVAKYAISFDSLPPVNPLQRRWAADRARMFKRVTHNHANSGPCGGGAKVEI
jgi:Zn-dependent M28 family amino/carboxypeptidase